MSDKDDLARLIAHTGRGHSGPIESIAPVLAAQIVAAGWRPPARTVTTVEELGALAFGTLVKDCYR